MGIAPLSAGTAGYCSHHSHDSDGVEVMQAEDVWGLMVTTVAALTGRRCPLGDTRRCQTWRPWSSFWTAAATTDAAGIHRSAPPCPPRVYAVCQ